VEDAEALREFTVEAVEVRSKRAAKSRETRFAVDASHVALSWSAPPPRVLAGHNQVADLCGYGTP
jgi:hypothetical protein